MFSNEKGLFKEAKDAKVLPNIFTAILWAAFFLIVGQILGELLSIVTQKIIGSNPAIIMLNTLICSFLFVSLLTFARVKFREKRPISSIGFGRKGFIKKYLLGFLIGLLMFSSVVLLLTISGNIEINNNPESLSGISALAGVLIVLPGWMIQGGTEEVLTRGWLMPVLGARYNVAVGLITSSMIFGVLHLLNPNVGVLAIVNIVLVGLFLGLYVIKTKDLWGVCGLHAAWNWSQGNVFGFEVSGQKVASGSLMHLKSTGTEWFTGGAFGPEAGLAATLVLSIGIIAVLLIKEKENYLFS